MAGGRFSPQICQLKDLMLNEVGTNRCRTLLETVVMNDTVDFLQAMPLQMSVKVLLSMLPCLFFLYVNGVMVFALLRKPLLLESPRYILFGHLLFTDSLQLILAMAMYILAVTMVKMISYVCLIITLFASLTVRMCPLNLAVMSLERYVAICFPLRHAKITTSRRTGVAIAVIWTIASIDSFTQLFLFISLETKSFTVPRFCSTNNVFRLQVYTTLNKAFTAVYFLLVSMIIIYTYVAIMIAVKSATSSVGKASKAHKTVLLHLLQLCLCIISTLFNMIKSSSMLNCNSVLGVHFQYLFFVGLIIFPKCLSPLVYGLRDPTFRQVFKYYFNFGIKTSVSPCPKS